MTGWECTRVVPAWGVMQARRPGADWRLVGNGVVDRAAPVLDQGVYPAVCNARLARRRPGLCVGGTPRRKGRTRTIEERSLGEMADETRLAA